MKQNNVGIYMWLNIHNNKCYIGQSVELKRRKYRFLNFNGRYNNGTSKIDYARKKYNKESDWKYEVLEYCTEEELDERESYWISFYNTIEEGYNLETGGSLNKHHSEESRKKMSESLKGKMTGENNPNFGKHHSEKIKKFLSDIKTGKPNLKCRKPILQYDLDGNFIKEWDSMITASKELGIHQNLISAVCRSKRKTAGNFLWKYHDGGEITLKIEGYEYIPWNKGKSCGISKKRKPVLQYDLEGNFIKEWDSATTASNELGINRGSINTVCRGELKTAGGYKWKYKELA